MTLAIDLITEGMSRKRSSHSDLSKRKAALVDTVQMTLQWGTSISVNAKHKLPGLQKVKDLSPSGR